MLADLSCNGTQSWLYRMLKYIDKDRFHIDLLVRNAVPQLFVDRFLDLGATIFCVPSKADGYRGRFRRLRNVREILFKNGPYDVIQSHEELNSGPYFLMAKQMNVPMRIVHSHSVDLLMADPFAVTTVAVRWLKKRLTLRYATHGFASSSQSAVALFGPNWTEDRRWQTFFCGIDLKPFEMFPDRISLRKSLGIPPEALVIGHVGRFITPKNHKKIISVFRNVLSKETGAYLLLVGDGPLRPSLEKHIRSLGLTERVVLTGLRVDAIELMRDVMDVFLFPSIHEGLGLALVEAQAAGLPCIISDAIPMDADVIREQVTRLSLFESDTIWRQSLLSAAAIGRSPLNPRLFSRFDIAKSIKSWETIYANAADWRL